MTNGLLTETESEAGLLEGQIIRSIDVVAIGPLWIAETFRTNPTQPERIAMGTTGIGTIGFNLINLFRLQPVEEDTGLVRKSRLIRLLDIPLGLFWFWQAFRPEPTLPERLGRLASGLGTVVANGVNFGINLQTKS